MANAQSKLTADQLQLLKRKLEGERKRILGVLGAAGVTPASASPEERSEFEETAQRTAEENDQLEIAERERVLLAEVERALEKLRSGNFGVDEETGESIPYERLVAIPWARRRVDE